MDLNLLQHPDFEQISMYKISTESNSLQTKKRRKKFFLKIGRKKNHNNQPPWARRKPCTATLVCTSLKTETPFRRQRNAVSRVSKRRLSIPLPSPQDFAPQLGEFCCLTEEIVFPNYPVGIAIPHILLFEMWQLWQRTAYFSVFATQAGNPHQLIIK